MWPRSEKGFFCGSCKLIFLVFLGFTVSSNVIESSCSARFIILDLATQSNLIIINNEI